MVIVFSALPTSSLYPAHIYWINNNHQQHPNINKKLIPKNSSMNMIESQPQSSAYFGLRSNFLWILPNFCSDIFPPHEKLNWTFNMQHCCGIDFDIVKMVCISLSPPTTNSNAILLFQKCAPCAIFKFGRSMSGHHTSYAISEEVTISKANFEILQTV